MQPLSPWAVAKLAQLCTQEYDRILKTSKDPALISSMQSLWETLDNASEMFVKPFPERG